MKIKLSTSIVLSSIILLQTSTSNALIQQKPAGLRPPYYLQVQGWQKCTKEKNMGTWRSLCMPKTKPDQCLEASWKDLQAKSKIPPC